MFEFEVKLVKNKARLVRIAWLLFFCSIFMQTEALASKKYVDYLADFQAAMSLSQTLDKSKQIKALKKWQTLEIQYPNDKAIANNYAVYLIRIGRVEEARDKLEQALKYDAHGKLLMNNLNAVYAFQAQTAYQKIFKETGVIPPTTLWASANKEPFKLQQQAQMEQVSKHLKVVLTEVENWRKAWSKQNVSAYLKFYTPKFVSSQYPNYKAWKKGRRISLTRPKFIKIKLTDMKVMPLALDLIQVTFKQYYRSDRFKDEVVKSMVWRLEKGKWHIVNERVVGR